MFSTFQQKLILGIFIFILLSIPIGAYLVSEYRTTVQSRANEPKNSQLPVTTPKPKATSAAKSLLGSSQVSQYANLLSSPEPASSSGTTLPTSYGPTLSLNINLEGRPANNQAVKLFVGIADGDLTSNPKFLLSFTIDIPASGQYEGLSLAGLTPGSKYTALLKGSAQIATAAAFTMSPVATSLNNGQTLLLLSGDLNDDNVVNSADYSIARKALSATPKASHWNENADFNKDGLINTFDLGLIAKNMGTAGASNAWVSPIPKVASSSANLTSPAIGGPQGSGYNPERESKGYNPERESKGYNPERESKGYWIWVPK